MRLLVLSAVFPPAPRGDADHVLHFCQHLRARGHEVELITSPRDGLLQGQGIRTHPVAGRWTWLDLPRILRQARECRPDAFYLFYAPALYDDHPMVTFLPSFCKRRCPGAPFVTAFEHTVRNSFAFPPLPTRALRKLVRLYVGSRGVDGQHGTLLRDSDRVIFLNSEFRDEVAPNDPTFAAKSLILPPPPPLHIAPDPDGTVRREVRAQLGVAEGEFLLAYFGYIYSNKGIDTLLQAIRLLAGESPKVRLVVVGGVVPHRELIDGYGSQMRQLSTSLGLDGLVTWTGSYPAESDLGSRYLRAADLGVLPFNEGIRLNNSSFAAVIAHGLPVVTTRGPFLDPVFREDANVLLCPPRDPEQLAAKIRSLVQDAELRTRVTAGATVLAREWFSWECAMDRTLEAIRQATPGR